MDPVCTSLHGRNNLAIEVQSVTLTGAQIADSKCWQEPSLGVERKPPSRRGSMIHRHWIAKES